MPKLRVLSGKDVVAILESFGFLIQSQQGSHLKLRRMPLRFIPESELRAQFYSE